MSDIDGSQHLDLIVRGDPRVQLLEESVGGIFLTDHEGVSQLDPALRAARSRVEEVLASNPRAFDGVSVSWRLSLSSDPLDPPRMHFVPDGYPQPFFLIEVDLPIQGPQYHKTPFLDVHCAHDYTSLGLRSYTFRGNHLWWTWAIAKPVSPFDPSLKVLDWSLLEDR